MNKSTKAILIACLISLAFIALPMRETYALPTRLVTNTTSITKLPEDAGGTFDWPIEIVDVSLLYGFDINVTWNNALITFNSISYTTELNAVWGTNPNKWSVLVNQQNVAGGVGSCKIVAVSLGLEFTKDPGNQALFTLKFNIVAQNKNHDRSTLLHFATNKLSDKGSNSIANTPTDGTYKMTGTKPAVALSSISVTRSTNGSRGNFTTTLSMSSTFDVTGFDFELHFDTSLLDYMKVDSWGDMGTGSVTPDETGGKITGTFTVTGDPLSGPHDIVTLMFMPNTIHVWKAPSITGWQNILTGAIFYQKADLTYEDPDPTLHYDKPGVTEISVGSDVAYTWSPMKGDVSLNGEVDIFDLSVVAGYYDLTPTNNPTRWAAAEPKYELTILSGEQIIDLFDLIIIASNYGAKA